MKNLKILSLGILGAVFTVSCATKEVSYAITPKSGTATGGTVTFKQMGKML